MLMTWFINLIGLAGLRQSDESYSTVYAKFGIEWNRNGLKIKQIQEWENCIALILTTIHTHTHTRQKACYGPTRRENKLFCWFSCNIIIAFWHGNGEKIDFFSFFRILPRFCHTCESYVIAVKKNSRPLMNRFY